MRYVPAFDGLRALAVMLVFLFHTRHVPGGWVGVDIFFVLSGYLITSILLAEHERTGVISLRHFYIRRACRLLPALVVVVCVAVVMALCFHNRVQDTESTR
jgi:peptidoglycan/LPS O-acetylase OafA/YrhL